MSEINVTPFVDVMLVLLIIFMVTAPMMVQGVDVNLPRTSSAPLKGEKEHLIITVNREGSVFINDQTVEVTTLTPKLRAVVIHVMSLIKEAGVESLGMITLPKENGSRISE